MTLPPKYDHIAAAASQVRADAGGPAFPRSSVLNGEAGMTLRDYFAIHAKDPMEYETWNKTECAKEIGIPIEEWSVLVHFPLLIAKRRYAYADAMLFERAKFGGA